ncbi:M20/M25/M40 family metallo-hydrolase [Pseudocnuella soli]|uniref:M20/M25/M40 family metallo-hydrolase n=1 Tax=Pseudocnuella soli TaxID=2502779 RepID=UPI00104EE6C9|nr:M20/M25/M40 family metallo-hydrolase [Pseudocnuella soli]
MKRILFSLALCSASFMSFAQNTDSVFLRRLANEVLHNSRAYENLRVLTKQIGGRLAGSPQMVQAEQWGLKAVQQAGAEKAWLQECMVPHWVRGGKDEATALNVPLANGARRGARMLDVVALGNSLGSNGRLTAPVIEIKSFDDLEAKKDLVRGKIVFYNYAFNPTFVKTFQAYSDANTYRSTGASRAAKYGAVGVIVRSLSHSVDNHPHTGGMRYDSAYAKIPALAIGLRDADWMSSQLAKAPFNVAMRTNGRFLPDTIGHNVIGELKGTEFPNEYITVGGHLDSWDNCEGAHDDGAGCVQTIEILRAFKALGYQPKRTIRFVLFANEENGLRGGTKYAEEAQTKGEKHIFALESDAGGFTPRGFGFTITNDKWAKVQGWQSLVAPYGASEWSLGGGGADIGPLNRTQGTPVAGLQPDSQRYFDVHHARNDVFEAVNKRELELGALNMAALIYLVDQHGL